MSYKHHVEVPSADGTEIEEVTLVFKNAGDVPIGILRRHRRNSDDQVWASAEWALSPEHLDLFDRLPAPTAWEVLAAWQKAGEKVLLKTLPKKKTKAVPAPAPDDEDDED